MFLEYPIRTPYKYSGYGTRLEDLSSHRCQALFHRLFLVDKVNKAHARLRQLRRLLGDAILEPSRLKDVDGSSYADLFAHR